jgi:hypothetical protein
MAQLLCCVELQIAVVFNCCGVFYWNYVLREHITISKKHKYTHGGSYPEEIQEKTNRTTVCTTIRHKNYGIQLNYFRRFQYLKHLKL